MSSVPCGAPRKPLQRLIFRAVLVAGVVCAVMKLGYVAYEAREERQVLADVRGMGGDVLYKSQLTYTQMEWPFPPAGPTSCLRLWQPRGIRGWLPSWIDSDWLDSIAAVDLYGKEIPREVLANIGRLRHLEYLEIGRAGFKTGELELLASCRTLRFLHLSGTRLDAADLSFLRNSRSLEELDLTDTDLTDRGLELLVPVPNLRRLWLGGTQVSGVGLANLRTCKKLEQLVLSGTKVDDNALPHLRELASLRVLDLRSTSVTQTGINDIRSELPNCKVFYEKE
jgi:hypothetical protein